MKEFQPVSISPTTDTPNISRLIYTIRNQQVMLASDLAMLYQVETRVLNQAVKRNQKRFPERYCFQLTKEEAERGCCTKVNLSLCNSLSFRIGADRRNNGNENLHLYRNRAHE